MTVVGRTGNDVLDGELAALGVAATVEILGEECHGKFAELKQRQADRCPKELGRVVKREEIMFHHEVTNQFLWNQF